MMQRTHRLPAAVFIPVGGAGDVDGVPGPHRPLAAVEAEHHFAPHHHLLVLDVGMAVARMRPPGSKKSGE